jgi:hypothetical protein
VGMDQTTSSKLKIDELNRIYSEGETCDKELFAEQRSNVLLSAGDHYSKKHSKWWSRIRDSKNLTSDQKLRITKNHIHKIVRTYINNIVSMAPGVIPTPNDPKDLQHVKTAELNKSVWNYAKEKHGLKMKTLRWAKDFIEIGEVFTKIYWEPNAGRFIGFEQETHEETGDPLFNEDGTPAASEKAVFSGDLLFGMVLPANVIRPSEAKTIEEAAWLCERQMVALDDLKNLVGDDEELEKLIVGSQDDTFFVFDSAKHNYTKTENQAMVRNFFWRPCTKYPNGYYAVCVQAGILFEGELPFGVFPLCYGGFDEISTTPRHRSIIKQLRPIQSEINRSASKMAETQVTLGDDKVILQNGSKVTTGPHLPGIRTMFVTGMAPTIMPGRTGDQYLPYNQSQVDELYRVSNVMEDSELTQNGQDAFANLYRSIRDKKKFSLYAEKFEMFLQSVCQTYLDLARHYFDENMLIPAIGKSEYINISEFKNTDTLCTRIKVEPQTEDINEMMGRHLTFNHILQYVGNQLDKDDIGKIIRSMPFSNSDVAFDDMAMDYDTSVNIILALDRGQQVQPSKSDNAEYIMKRLGSRMQKPDYRMLAPQIQMAYDNLKAQYEQILANKAQALKQMESQFIPSGGAMIKVDYYVPDPTNTARSIRATVPAESVDWLIKQLEAQGSAQQQLQEQSPQVQTELSMLIANKGPVPRQFVQPPMGMPQQPQMPRPGLNHFPRG